VIPYGHQSINDDDIQAVVNVLKGEWLTQGPHIEEFEEALAARTECRYAVAFSSGTAALHAAAAVAGLGPGDAVATSALTFVASANCARFVGATPVLVDIDPETLNVDPGRIPANVKALVAVHFAGLPIDLGALRPRPPLVIEDASHALGATTPDGPVGNCAHSEMTVFSFHPVKAITMGEGGAVTTNDPTLADALRRFRSHGTVRLPAEDPWRYDACELGYNYRLTDIQAALGTSQLSRLDAFLAKRHDLARRYRLALGAAPVRLPPEPRPGFSHAYHLFPVRLRERRRIFDAMRRAGIGVQVHYVPLYRHSSYATPELSPDRFPATEAAYGELLSLPLFPDLREAEQDFVIETLCELL
jgi:UDP-4-amino-4,6-dideoxy-N-acetyl-beta-L-altrosamine transaminase